MRGNGQCTGQRNSYRIGHRDHTQRKLFPVCVVYLLGHPIEGIDVGSAAQQALPEDHSEHEPNAGRERVDDLEQEEDHVDKLEHGHQPDLVKLNQIDRGPRDEHTWREEQRRQLNPKRIDSNVCPESESFE